MARDRDSRIRGDFFISKQFQARFILKFCLIALIGGLLFSGLVLYYCQGTLTASFHESRLVLKNTALSVFPAVVYTNLIMLAVVFFVILVVILYLSRMIIMPMFRFSNDIKVIGNGDLTGKIQYRYRDQTTSLAQNINMMTESLNRKICQIRTGLQQVIDDASKEDVPEGLAIDLIRLHRRIGQSFKL